MNKRFQANEHILSGPAFCFAIAFLLCSTAIAQPEQIEPYPTNPLGNTIIINNNSIDYSFNDVIGVGLVGWLRRRRTI